jgi:hypothetical protein
MIGRRPGPGAIPGGRRTPGAPGPLGGSGGQAQAASGHPWVRPYVLTRGRTRTKRPLLVHSLVSAPRFDASFAARLPPEARRLYSRACTQAESVAELSAHCGVPLGVTRVLLADLAAGNRIHITPEPSSSPFDRDLLERVIDGLRQYA